MYVDDRQRTNLMKTDASGPPNAKESGDNSHQISTKEEGIEEGKVIVNKLLKSRKSMAKTDKVPRLRILLLGASGAGKTVYLASMYRKLSLPSKDCSYNIVTNHKTALHLHKQIEQIKKPGHEWPSGTRKLDSWEFECYVNTKNGKHKAFEFVYLDYAGGCFTSLSNDQSTADQGQQLEEFATKADLIMGLLDGEKILRFMDGKDSSELIDTDLRLILETMEKHKPTLPIYFIISKWDMIEKLGKHTLMSIRDRLKEVEDMKNVLDSRGPKPVHRLIPVSAIGNQSAEYIKDESSGAILTEKHSGQKSTSTFQVEMPLTFVLEDVINKAILELQESREGLKGLNRFLNWLVSIFSNPLREYLPPGLGWITEELAGQLQKELGKSLRSDLERIRCQEDVLKYLMSDFRIAQERFKDNNAGSLL
jgi:hypothetical protein